MNNELVKKSIRLPSDLVEYVDAQQGRDFSKKLVTLLMELREGDTKRQDMLQQYDQQFNDYRKRLDELRHEIYEKSELLRQLSNTLSYAERIVANTPCVSQEEREMPESAAGRS